MCVWLYFRGQRGQLNRELREGEGKVKMLSSSRANQLLAYGEWMPGLVRAVNTAQPQFKKPPKGPIGVSNFSLPPFFFF